MATALSDSPRDSARFSRIATHRQRDELSGQQFGDCPLICSASIANFVINFKINTAKFQNTLQKFQISRILTVDSQLIIIDIS